MTRCQPFLFRREGRPNWYLGYTRPDGKKIQLSLRTQSEERARLILEDHKRSPYTPAQRIRYTEKDLAQVPAAITDRQSRINYLLALRAMHVMATDEKPDRFQPFFDGRYKCVMTQLGRIPNANKLRTAAQAILDQKMSMHTALRFIAQARGVRFDDPYVGQKIETAIREHCKLHPATTYREIVTALQALTWDYQDKIKRDEATAA